MPEYPETVNYPSTPEQYEHHYDAEDRARSRHYTIAPFHHPEHPYAHEVRRIIGHDKSTRVAKYKTLEQAQYVANTMNEYAAEEL